MYLYFRNLVYSRVELNKEGKLTLENIINLRKKNSEIPKKNKIVKPYYTLKEMDTTLLFESRFESGNLLSAFKVSEYSYQLLIQNDTNTNGYSQWFFFRVSNVMKGTKVKLNILNMMKKYSLYKRGMKILIYSEKKAATEKVGWHRGGAGILYYSNGLFKFVRDTKRPLYSLCFNYEFEYDNDVVYFANAWPYTYTDITKELNEFKKNETKYDYITRKSLCTTLAGNNLEYFTITSNDKNFPIEEREGVVLMARVHPGESVGSFMMKGVIDFLTGDSDEAIYLRNHFVIKIIPMMNPDGVICGNYRTSLAGCDLNRRWTSPHEILHPEVYNAKQMILKFSTQRKIAFICDFHGHSGAHNIFMYGNNIPHEPYLCKIFPYLLSKTNSHFNFSQCAFKMTSDKLGTARINLFNELSQFPNIFTIEASFAGSSKGPLENCHFNTMALMEIGRDLCLTLMYYHQSYSKINNNLFDELKIEAEIRDRLRKERKERLSMKMLNTSQGSDEEKSEGSMSSGSDSEPSLDNIEKEVLVKLLPTQGKKKKKTFGKKPKNNLYISSKKNSILLKKKPNENENQLSRKNNSQDILSIPNSIIQLKNDKPVNKPAANVIKIKTKSENLIQEDSQQDNKENIKTVAIKINISNTPLKNMNISRKKDAETQTEDEFFKAHWSFFQNKYTILSAKISKNIVLNSNFNKSGSIFTDKNGLSFVNNFGNFDAKISSHGNKISLATRNLNKNSKSLNPIIAKNK